MPSERSMRLPLQPHWRISTVSNPALKMVNSIIIIVDFHFEQNSSSKHTFHKGTEGGDIEMPKEWPKEGENKSSAIEKGTEQCLVDNFGQSG